MSTFKRAQRQAVKLKELHTGPSGSGKTKGALAIATALFPGKVAGIDSENDRMLYYADQYEFEHLSLESHKPSDYIAAIDLAVSEGFSIAVIDSLSHAWQNVLDRKNLYDKQNPSKNSYTTWATFGTEWDKLIRHILDAPIHIIATARSKQAYELVENDRGKKEPIKLGMAPQVREGAEYEFALVFDLNLTHRAKCMKDNTGLFDDETAMWDLCDPKTAKKLGAWLAGGAPAAPKPDVTTLTLTQAETMNVRGRIVGQLDDVKLTAMHAWARGQGNALAERACEMVMAARTEGASDRPNTTTPLAAPPRDDEYGTPTVETAPLTVTDGDAVQNDPHFVEAARRGARKDDPYTGSAAA